MHKRIVRDNVDIRRIQFLRKSTILGLRVDPRDPAHIVRESRGRVQVRLIFIHILYFLLKRVDEQFAKVQLRTDILRHNFGHDYCHLARLFILSQRSFAREIKTGHFIDRNELFWVVFFARLARVWRDFWDIFAQRVSFESVDQILAISEVAVG